MNIETITVPPVPVLPVKTYVLTLNETEAQALKMLTGFQSRQTIATAAKNTLFGASIKDREIDTIRVVNDKLFDALDDAKVGPLPESK